MNRYAVKVSREQAGETKRNKPDGELKKGAANESKTTKKEDKKNRWKKKEQQQER